MNLGYHSTDKLDPNPHYTLDMTPEEFHKAIAGKPIKHETFCMEMSGVWEVKFIKNSKAKHKKLIGG
jgi:hypothetical protein